MATFSKLLTSNTGFGFYYEKNSRQASKVFNQEAVGLYRNQPRFAFQYYVDIGVNNIGTAGDFIKNFFISGERISPLIKRVDMPSMKIDTTPLNQYNRKRISQRKITFDPVKIVFHDVADGKTLKFWDMYYRYYFKDGNEPGQNDPKNPQGKNKSFSLEQLGRSLVPRINPAIANLPTSVKRLFKSDSPTGANSPTSNVGEKRDYQNIVADTIENHKFGFNLEQVAGVRNLLNYIDIFQVHGGRFNQVRLVNPRISTFSHDTLEYAGSDRTLELTFTFEYEYAYYIIQNLKLDGGEKNNNGSIEPFEGSEHLELPALAFNTTLLNFIESNNPLLNSDNPILQRIGRNAQSSLGSVTGAALSDRVVRPVSASALNGLANISPKANTRRTPPPIQARNFSSTATQPPLNNPPNTLPYRDFNRTGGGIGNG